MKNALKALALMYLIIQGFALSVIYIFIWLDKPINNYIVYTAAFVLTAALLAIFNKGSKHEDC